MIALCYFVCDLTPSILIDTNGQEEETDGSSIPSKYIRFYCLIIIPIVLILTKPPKKSDLNRIFRPHANYYRIIGIALDVGVVDLMTSQSQNGDKLILVFERWIDSDKEVTWEKMLEVCKDYPNELGKAKNELIIFLKSERAHKSYLN